MKSELPSKMPPPGFFIGASALALAAVAICWAITATPESRLKALYKKKSDIHNYVIKFNGQAYIGGFKDEPVLGSTGKTFEEVYRKLLWETEFSQEQFRELDRKWTNIAIPK